MIQRGSSLTTRDVILIVVCVLVAVIVFITQFSDVSTVPFLSEDWTQLAEMKAVPTFLGAFDPHLEPLRPFQHAYFWILAHAFDGRSTDASVVLVAHCFAFVLHAISCVLVYRLAREMGIGVLGALAAAWLFAMFPNVKSIAWPAAIGSPGRVTFELLALVCLLRHAKSKSRSSGVFGVAAFVLALGFHESAMLVPVFVALWLVFSEGTSMRDGFVRLSRRVRDPWFAAIAVLATVHVVHLAFLRPERHHQLKSLAALPANFVKASLSLAPEFVRVAAVDGLRGPTGSALFALGAAIVVGVIAFAMWVASQNSFARFIVAAIAIELALPMVGAGFAQRYAYFASVFLAIGIAAWFAQSPRGLRESIVLLIGFSFGYDARSDRIDVRGAGVQARQFVALAHEERTKAGRGVPIAIVDAPDMTGDEHDIPLFNWGADMMLDAHRVEGPWLFWRTREFHTSTNFERVDDGRIEDARRAGSPRVLVMESNAN